MVIINPIFMSKLSKIFHAVPAISCNRAIIEKNSVPYAVMNPIL